MYFFTIYQLFLPQVNYNEGKPEKLVYVRAGCSVKVFTW